MPESHSLLTIDEVYAVIKETNEDAAGILDKILPRHTVDRQERRYTAIQLIRDLLKPNYGNFDGQFTPQYSEIQRHVSKLEMYGEVGELLAGEYIEKCNVLEDTATDMLRTDFSLEEYLRIFIEFDRMHNEFVTLQKKVNKQEREHVPQIELLRMGYA